MASCWYWWGHVFKFNHFIGGNSRAQTICDHCHTDDYQRHGRHRRQPYHAIPTQPLCLWLVVASQANRLTGWLADWLKLNWTERLAAPACVLMLALTRWLVVGAPSPPTTTSSHCYIACFACVSCVVDGSFLMINLSYSRPQLLCSAYSASFVCSVCVMIYIMKQIVRQSGTQTSICGSRVRQFVCGTRASSCASRPHQALVLVRVYSILTGNF